MVLFFNSEAYSSIFIIAGGSNSNGLMNSVEIYDVATDRWTDGPTLPIHVYGHQMIIANSKVVFLGGSSTEIGDEKRFFELGEHRECAC